MFDSYPEEIVSNTNKQDPKISEDSIFIRRIKPIDEDDIAYGHYLKLSIISKILTPKNPREITELSLSLEGEFKPEYICLKLNNKTGDWDHNTDIDPESVEFEETDEKPLFINLNKKVALIREFTDEETKKSRVLEMKFIWKPVDANFYHFQIKIEEQDTGTVYNRESSSKVEKRFEEKIAAQVLFNMIDEQRSISASMR